MHAPKRSFRGIFVKWHRVRVLAAVFKVSPRPRFREIALKFLYDNYMAQLAWRMRRS
jgi:hypothetical protein